MVTPDMLEGKVWMEKYGDLTSATRKYKETAEDKKLDALLEVLVKVKELIPLKIAPFLFGTGIKYDLSEIKEIVEEYKDCNFSNKSLVDTIGEIYYHYAILHENLFKKDQVLPLLLKVEKFLDKIYTNDKILSYTHPKTLLQIGMYGSNEGIDQKKYFDKANNFFNKVEGNKEVILEEKVKFFLTYGISKIQEGDIQSAITIFNQLEASVEEFAKVAAKDNDFLFVAYHNVARVMTRIKQNEKAIRYYEKVLSYIETLVREYLPREREIDMSFGMFMPSMSYSPSEIGTAQYARKQERMREQLIQIAKQKADADPRCKYIRIGLEYVSCLMAANKKQIADSFLNRIQLRYESVFEKYEAFKPTQALFKMTYGLIKQENRNPKLALDYMEKGWKIFKESRHFNENQVEILDKSVPLAYLMIDAERDKEAENVLYEHLGFIDDLNEPETETVTQYLEFLGYAALLDLHLKSNRIEDGFNIMRNGLDKIVELFDTYPPAIIPLQKEHIEIFFNLAEEMCEKQPESEICIEIEEKKGYIQKKIE